MKICVAGVGNIGMRYVQGISKSFPDAQLYLVDSPARLDELKALNLANASLLESVNEISEAIDLCVVATSCGPRLALYKQCLDLEPRYVVLEKYLFSNRQQFDDCLSLDRVPTFVNQWLYGSGTFDCLFENEARSVRLVGCDWGLACNAVHWIDVFKRHMNISNLEVGSDTRIAKVFPSKRDGYEEIYGELVFVDRDSGRSFSLVDEGDARFAGFQEISVDEKVYRFDFARISRGDEVLSQFPYLSDIVGDITGSIIGTGGSHLPSLEESISQHLLVEDILAALSSRPNIT